MRLDLVLTFVSFAVASHLARRVPLLGPLKYSPLLPVSKTPKRSSYNRVSSALRSPIVLNERQAAVCDPGQDFCGDKCKNSTATCCPGQENACDVGTYCSLDVSGLYVCCDDGEICGSGGVCDEGKKGCGEFCIYLADTCCPDRLGGCPPGTYCDRDDSGGYGCCDDGEVCAGSGGGGPIVGGISSARPVPTFTLIPTLTLISLTRPSLATIFPTSRLHISTSTYIISTNPTPSFDLIVTVTATPSTSTRTSSTATRTRTDFSIDDGSLTTSQPSFTLSGGAASTESSQLSAGSLNIDSISYFALVITFLGASFGALLMF